MRSEIKVALQHALLHGRPACPWKAASGYLLTDTDHGTRHVPWCQTVQPERAFLSDRAVPVSDPDVSRPRLVRDATFLEADRREIALRRGPKNRLGFAYQVAFVRVLGRFPQQTPLEIDGEILRFAALQLGADAETIGLFAGGGEILRLARPASRSSGFRTQGPSGPARAAGPAGRRTGRASPA